MALIALFKRWRVPLVLLIALDFTLMSAENQNTQEDQQQFTNRLIDSMSPYLKQHAHNPVDWYEWSDEAFAEAKKRDLPVIVSIGYSTCHWCHVMAHESFEDEATAQIMNELFVCIKVDREEHPEVDEIYMDTVQAMTGHGGWPLNAVVDHEGRPFFAGTYFPRAQWQDVLKQLSDVWTNDRERVNQAAESITAHLRQMNERQSTELNQDIWKQLSAQCLKSFDEENPGFNAKPKFPPSQLLPLLLAYKGPHDAALDAMAEQILEAMQDGGIHDRVGGGFHRYSVDEEWRLPHFEKMLYDNAQLMGVYAQAAVQLERADFMQTAKNIAAYLDRDLAMYEGLAFIGYASAEDADDPGGEGSFYAWNPDLLAQVLEKELADQLARVWDVQTGKAHVGRSGHFEPVLSHIPHPRAVDLKALADNGDVQALRASWEAYYPKLRAERDKRPRPSRDDKILTDLNGLALRGLALLARYSGEEQYAQRCRDLISIIRLRSENGLKRIGDHPAFITDYGHCMMGLTEAFAVLGDPLIITLAEDLGNEAIRLLRAEDGGFYTTPIGRDDLIRRSREDFDNAYPSGIHALALSFVRLAHITGDNKWRETAEGILNVQASLAQRAPTACATLLSAYLEYQRGAVTAVITGDHNDEMHDKLKTQLLRQDIAGMQIISVGACKQMNWPNLELRKDINDVQVLLCIGQHCLLPANNAEELEQRLQTLRSQVLEQ